MLKDELDFDGRPNLNLAGFVGTYMEPEVEALMVENLSKNMSDTDEYLATSDSTQRPVKQSIEENTMGVFIIMGSTYTGHSEPVEEIPKILDEYEAKTGIDIPIHVDAASGGFIAPFIHGQAGGPKWNIELPRVKSINTSGYKFGLVYAGLGGTEESYTLNFSRPGAQIIAQYYNLIRLGFNGYKAILENSLRNARLLRKPLEATGCQPVVAFRFSDQFKKEYPHVRQEAVSKLLRMKQYIIPNCPLPPNEEKIEILRVVVRESMNLDLLDRLVCDTIEVAEWQMQMNAVDLSALY
ncbi:hypothetical protein DV737_g154, partial [Chaetothyriales sp. CBS 132003]